MMGQAECDNRLCMDDVQWDSFDIQNALAHAYIMRFSNIQLTGGISLHGVFTNEVRPATCA